MSPQVTDNQRVAGWFSGGFPGFFRSGRVFAEKRRRGTTTESHTKPAGSKLSRRSLFGLFALAPAVPAGIAATATAVPAATDLESAFSRFQSRQDRRLRQLTAGVPFDFGAAEHVLDLRAASQRYL